MKWNELREDTTFGLNVLTAGIAMAGAGGMTTLVKSRLYPGARPPTLVFANRCPPCTTCGEIQPESLSARPATPSPDPARQKPGREDNPAPRVHPMVAPIWSLRLSWHLPKWCKGKSVDSFEEWLTTQMFGMTATGGSEIDYNLVQYSESQWFRMVLERVGLPITPKPAMVLVDQFEELLKRFPVQARLGKHTDQPAHPRQPCPGDLRLQLGCWLSDLAQFEPRRSL